MDELRPLLTRKELAGIFQIKCVKKTLRSWEQRGILHPVRIGNVVRYRREDIEKLIGGL